jgi:hypothetical protein
VAGQAIDDLIRQGLSGTLADETQVVYVSPLTKSGSTDPTNVGGSGRAAPTPPMTPMTPMTPMPTVGEDDAVPPGGEAEI